MSRALPTHPNLEHLRKQAKDRLGDLQSRNPDSKLAAAQHAIAREYGFPSWPKLRAHVESLPRPASRAVALAGVQSESAGTGGGGGTAANATDSPTPNYGFNRYTLTARQALFFSRYEASQCGSGLIETAHVLLALIRVSQGLKGHILERAHLSLERARAEVGASAAAREKLPTSVEIPFSTETKRVLLHAAEEADRLQHHRIGTTHLLVGILREGQSVAASILRDNGIRLDSIRDDATRPPDEETI
jgi:hypothetical protein